MRNAPEKIEVVVTEGEIRTRSPSRTPDALEQLWTVERAHRVSVVIPCYKQAHFLGEAIESVLAQSHPAEIVVVDDGSPDNTKQVASRYPQVRYIRQENKGLAEARNAGFTITTGDYLIFLDSDDRLLPNAIEQHLQCFAEHPEAGFVVGDIDHISTDGSYSYSPRWPILRANFYEELLRVNHVANTIAVMFRREVIEGVGGFDNSCSPAADYRVLLQAARVFPSAHHRSVVAQYRHHPANMSRQGIAMLRALHRVMELERPIIRGKRRLEAAYRIGDRYWRDHYAARAIKELFASLRQGKILKAGKSLLELLWRMRGRLFVIPWNYRSHALRVVRKWLKRNSGGKSRRRIRGQRSDSSFEQSGTCAKGLGTRVNDG